MTVFRITALALWVAVLVLCPITTPATGWAEEKMDVGAIREASGAQGGLVVHLGCGDGRLTAAFGEAGGVLVQGLEADAAQVVKARAYIQSLGLYGKVSVNHFDGQQLPYIDNLVNLVVDETSGAVSMEEILRVLAPGGVACSLRDGSWTKTVKPWPDEIDDWTHFQHGPDNNAVAEDEVVGPPRRMQWLAGPTWTRHHHSDKGTAPTIRAVVSSRGRLYYTIDETATSNMKVPSQWFLAARDAFSGVLLWKVPIRRAGYQRRLEEVWRGLIADGDAVYAQLGADEPLSELNGVTGARNRTYPGTESVSEVIKHQGSLFVVTGDSVLLALDAASGKLLWHWEPDEEGPMVPLTLAAAEGKVFVRTDVSLRCLAAADGKPLWRFTPPGARKRIRLKWPRERLLVKDGVVLCSYGGGNPNVLNRDSYEFLGSHPRVHEYGAKLAALSAADGSLLWTTDYLPGLESMPGEIYVSQGRVWLGPDFASPRDLRSGEVLDNRPLIDRLWTAGHHYRCYPGKATSRYIITAKRGIELFDTAGDDHSRNNWVRGTCRVGVTPANGLLYVPPHSCGCYMEAKLFGFWALASEQDVSDAKQSTDESARFQKGHAYGQPGLLDVASDEAADWPTYRGDGARTGATRSSGPRSPKPLWSTAIDGRLSAVVVSDGRLFVAQVDAHTVHAIDADSGEPLWQFTAGGRIDSPPTIYRGLALFGSRDGWIYCLRASSGELVWRRQAAPRSELAVACEQLESLWPVHGSVLVHDDIVYAAAGRSSYLDDGIVLYGLEPATGKVLCTTRLNSDHAGATPPRDIHQREKMESRFSQNHLDYKTFAAPDRSDAFSMSGALPDVLVADSDSVFMRNLRFDDRLTQQDERLPHLFSTSFFLDGREHNRAYWVFGTSDFSRTPVAYPWIVTKSLAVPYGVFLAYDDATVWGVRRGGKGQETNYFVFARPRPDASTQQSRLPDFQTRTGQKSPPKDLWVAELAMRPRAMIRAGDTLFVGGMTNEFDPNDPALPKNAEYHGRGQGLLDIVSATDGQTLGRVTLESPPVWDSMAVLEGRLYLATRSGAVVCLADE